MTLAGWDEKACLAAVADPKTPPEVLNYFISSDNLRPALLPALLDNPSIREEQIAKLANSVLRDIIEIMLKSPRVRSSRVVVAALKSNPYSQARGSCGTGQLAGSSVGSRRACCWHQFASARERC